MNKKLYILISTTYTKADFIFKRLTFSRYTHASLSLDNVNFYSFTVRGFSEEHPAHIRKKCETICYEIDIDEQEYEFIKERIEYFKNNKTKYKYAYMGIFFSMMHIKMNIKNKYFCSQFVAEMLAKSGVTDLPKAPSLMLPKHLVKALGNIVRPFKIYRHAYAAR